MTTEIKPDTVWRNNKKGTLYRVWCIATDLFNRQFVIYHESEIINKTQLYTSMTVKHSENSEIGLLCHDSLIWLSVDEEQKSRFDAWARPIEMWHEKFTEVTDNVAN